MKQAAKGARKFHDMVAASFATAKATPPAQPAEPTHAVPLDLKSLIAPYRGHTHLSLRVENLPQSARLSAGQNNGDRTWSLMLHELEDLVYFPPKAAKAGQVLALRLIAKDEAQAYTIALIDLPVAEAGALAAAPPVHVAAKPVPFARASKEVEELKAALAGREAELSASRAAAGRMEIHWQTKLKTALADGETVWRKEEALRLEVAKAELEEKWTRRLKDMRAEAEAALREAQAFWKQDEALRLEAVKRELEEARKPAHPRAPAAEQHDLSQLRQDLVAAKDALVAGKAEQARLQTELERQKRQSETDIAQVKALAETARAAALGSTEANLTAQADKRRAALKARAEAAEAAQSSAEAAAQARQDEIAGLKEELEQQRQSAQMAQARAETMAARPLHDDAYVRGLEREIKSLRASLVDREADIAHGHVMEDIRSPRSATGSWRPLSNRQQAPEESQSHLFRDALIAIAGGAMAVLLFPQIEAQLPNNWRWQIETLGGLRDISEAEAPRPAPVPVPMPKASPAPKPAAASLARAANLRQEPSVNAAIIASLTRGQQLSVLEKRGNWDHVEISDTQQGWVYDSYVTP